MAKLTRYSFADDEGAYEYCTSSDVEKLEAELTALREENERLTKAYQELELLVSQAQPESHWLGEGKTT